MSKNNFIQAFADSFDNIEYAEAIVKWAPLIESTAYRVSKIIKQDADDTRQDILLDLAAVSDYYASPLYRYKNRVWRVQQQSGRLALVESPIHIVQRMTPRWLYRAFLTPVKKSSASAFVYRRVVQHIPNAAAKHFRKKNGYETVKTLQNIVSRSSKKVGAQKKIVPVPTQIYTHVGSEALINVSDLGHNPEEACGLNRLLSGASTQTQNIVKLLLTGGVFADTVLSKRTGLSVRQVVHAKAELYRQLRQRDYPAGCKPVYFDVEHLQ